jgi:hypothetical protein
MVLKSQANMVGIKQVGRVDRKECDVESLFPSAGWSCMTNVHLKNDLCKTVEKSGVTYHVICSRCQSCRI